MKTTERRIAHYHLPGLFEFYELYRVFLPIFQEHREYFYDWCNIASIYGAPSDCLWGGGREGIGENDAREILNLLERYDISARLTFSNSLLREEHLPDKKCNRLCSIFSEHTRKCGISHGVIIHSDLLLHYLKMNYPELYYVSSTTKVLTNFEDFSKELEREDFTYVVPDFRLNKSLEGLNNLSSSQKQKVEFLCNECCWFGCKDRKKCYEDVSRKILDEEILQYHDSESGEKEYQVISQHHCTAPGGKEGYKFSKAMKNPGFIGIDDIQDIYLPMGFTNFKIEGRALGSALILEFLLYYLTKPEYQIHVREMIYLDSMLDLF